MTGQKCMQLQNANTKCICILHFDKNQFDQNHTVVTPTGSSAVAKRPRDASCLSVVCFNST